MCSPRPNESKKKTYAQQNEYAICKSTTAYINKQTHINDLKIEWQPLSLCHTQNAVAFIRFENENKKTVHNKRINIVLKTRKHNDCHSIDNQRKKKNEQQQQKHEKRE